MSSNTNERARKRTSRFILLAIFCVIGVIVGVIWGTSQLTGKGPEEFENPTANIDLPQQKVRPVQCKPTDIEVETLTTDKKYVAGKNPVFNFNVTNKSDGACYFNFGTSQQNFVVKSGDALVWQSADCPKTPGDNRLIVLQPKQTLKSASLEWNRTLSHKDKCDAPKESVKPGTYRVQVQLGGATMKDPVQFVLE